MFLFKTVVIFDKNKIQYKIISVILTVVCRFVFVVKSKNWRPFNWTVFKTTKLNITDVQIGVGFHR